MSGGDSNNAQALKPESLLRSGRYRVCECLGRSPLGYTYLARDSEADSSDDLVTVEEFYPHGHCRREARTDPQGNAYEEVAILRTDAYQAKKLYARFMAMARTLHSVLTVDGITGVTAAFKEGGTAYYVHHYIPGPTLQSLLDSGQPLSQRKVMRYFAALCHTLDALQMRGIHVGALDPGNIIIARDTDLPVIVETPLITGTDAPAEGLSAQLLDEAEPHDDVYVLGQLLRRMVRDRQGYYPSWFTPAMQRVMDMALNPEVRRGRPDTPTALWDALNRAPSPAVIEDRKPAQTLSLGDGETLKPHGLPDEPISGREGARMLTLLIVLLALSALIWIYLTFINA